MESQKCSFRILMFPYISLPRVSKENLEQEKLPHLLVLHRHQFHIHKNSLQNSIEVVQLQLESNPQLPPHYHTTKNLPSDLIRCLLKAFQTAKTSFSRILTNLNPDLIIYDIFQPWAAAAASPQSIPAVHFAPCGAATMSYFHHAYTCWDQNFTFTELHLHPNEKSSLDCLTNSLLVEVFDRDKNVIFVNYHLSSEVVLLKTNRSLEGKYVDYLSSLFHNRILGVGPLVTEVDGEEMDSDIMRWLGKKKGNSTVYISFGSEYFLSKEEIMEIAKGLELCEASFIWVIRFPATEERGSAEEVLPEGFLERMRERGRGWVPQANILGHPSTGAFASHCGWSSLNESIYYGVPVVGMPMKINMFVDAKMLVDAGACVEVGRDGNGVFKGEEIAKAINGVIVEESGEGLRSRARELSDKMRMEEEGAIDEAAKHLWQLCCKNKNNDRLKNRSNILRVVCEIN